MKAVKKRFPKIKILAYSMHTDPVYVEKAIRAGADGFVTKEENSKNVANAIREILSGKLHISEKISGSVLKILLSKKEEDQNMAVEKLTDREFEIFQYIGNGIATRKISKILCLSISTIESHRMNIKKKLHLSTNAELVQSAITRKLKINRE